MWQAVIVEFALVAKIARPIRYNARSSHCINLNIGGQSYFVGTSAFYNSNLKNTFEPGLLH